MLHTIYVVYINRSIALCTVYIQYLERYFGSSQLHRIGFPVSGVQRASLSKNPGFAVVIGGFHRTSRKSRDFKLAMTGAQRMTSYQQSCPRVTRVLLRSDQTSRTTTATSLGINAVKRHSSSPLTYPSAEYDLRSAPVGRFSRALFDTDLLCLSVQSKSTKSALSSPTAPEDKILALSRLFNRGRRPMPSGFTNHSLMRYRLPILSLSSRELL